MGTEIGALRVPVQKRIMILLWDHLYSEEDYEVPEIISQMGIGKELGLRQTHVSRAMSELSNEGLVRSRTAHIRGMDRRKKVYFLTQKGIEETKRSIEELQAKYIPVRGKDRTLKLLPISKVLRSIGRSKEKDPTLHELFTRYFDGSEVDLSKGDLSTIGPKRLPVNPHFYGRNSELEIISTAIDQKGKILLCIVSIAGQGKTSLLSHFASKVKDRPLAWTNIDEWTRPMNVLEDWALMLDRLGSSKTLEYLRGPKEPTLDRTVSLVIKELQGTGSILILDDLHKSSDVHELIAMLKQRIPPDTDATIIIGTRKRPEFYGRKDTYEGGRVVEIELRGLDEKSAYKLLRERGVPEEEHALAYKMTRGHPLALELYTTGFDLDGYLWEEVTRGLTSKEREILDLASIYRQPVTAEAFFFEGKPEFELLHNLTDKVLLRRFDDGTYGIHDILREHLRDSLTADEISQNLEVALAFLLKRGSDRDLLHYIGLLSEHDRKELSSVILKEGDLLVSKGHDHILKLVTRIDPHSLKGLDIARYLILFSDLNIKEGDTDAAKGKLDRALEVCDQYLKNAKDENRRTEVLSLVSRALYRSGEISRSKGIHAEALEAQMRNVAYNRKYGNRAELGKALNNLALAYLDRGEVDSALGSLLEAKSVLEESGDPSSRAFVEASIADVHIMKRDHKKARKYLERASSFRSKLPAIHGKLKRRTGLCWSKLEGYIEASNDLREAYSSFVEAGDKETALWVLLDLHMVARARNDIGQALDHLDRVSKGISDMKISTQQKNELILQCAKLRFEMTAQENAGKIGPAARELVEIVIDTMEPKRSILYLDVLIKETRRIEQILPVLEDFERLSWQKGDRNGSIVISLRRASLLLEIGRTEEVRKLLGTVIDRARKAGFRKAIMKAEELLLQV
ncbi:MAG: hypothetical protein JXA22_01460 [Candidatus Thermoplasmatota archaeon]|nr:hypothetical protein [Candidatus Thermoplasmatota archaeon]